MIARRSRPQTNQMARGFISRSQVVGHHGRTHEAGRKRSKKTRGKRRWISRSCARKHSWGQQNTIHTPEKERAQIDALLGGSSFESQKINE